MTPKPHPRLLELARVALAKARERRNSERDSVQRDKELQAVSQSAGIPLVAAKFWIALLDGREEEVVDPQYIP